jgi:hypothetical protein
MVLHGLEYGAAWPAWSMVLHGLEYGAAWPAWSMVLHGLAMESRSSTRSLISQICNHIVKQNSYYFNSRNA